MNKRKKVIGAVLLILALIGVWLMMKKSDEPVKTKEDQKVNELLKSQKERSDSMKRALGIE